MQAFPTHSSHLYAIERRGGLDRLVQALKPRFFPPQRAVENSDEQCKRDYARALDGWTCFQCAFAVATNKKVSAKSAAYILTVRTGGEHSIHRATWCHCKMVPYESNSTMYNSLSTRYL
ncbi:b2.1 [Ichnoviriform fugitivi]|uniref:B2.1 n=1 Tax=Ichnoviriform fugitivi TaxID=265522 RepID=A2Q0D2_9VIRU|nr:b2.1 [Ichnoviriform fugitivi]BAF45647.1 b2.1 [Ichnoviriform fugitivi]